jgi:hypothetical protein
LWLRLKGSRSGEGSVVWKERIHFSFAVLVWPMSMTGSVQLVWHVTGFLLHEPAAFELYRILQLEIHWTSHLCIHFIYIFDCFPICHISHVIKGPRHNFIAALAMNTKTKQNRSSLLFCCAIYRLVWLRDRLASLLIYLRPSLFKLIYLVWLQISSSGACSIAGVVNNRQLVWLFCLAASLLVDCRCVKVSFSGWCLFLWLLGGLTMASRDCQVSEWSTCCVQWALCSSQVASPWVQPTQQNTA